VTDQQRNVELVIRAKNLSKKTLENVRKEIEDVNQALDDQVAAANRGEGSLKDLDILYKRVEASLKSLANQQGLIEQFKKQQAQLETLQQKLGAASTKLRDYQKALGEGTEVTRRQEQTQTRLTKAVEQAETALAKQAQRLGDTREQASQLGLNLNDLVGTQDRLLQSSRALSNVNVRLADDVDNFAARMGAANREIKKFAEQETFDKQAREAAELVRASEYVNFWITALEKADAAQRQLTDTTELNKIADRAIAAARGYTTLGDASRRLIQNSKGLAGTLREIADPAAAARTSLGGIEEEVNALASAINQLKGPVKDYREQVRLLSEAQRAIASQGAAIDVYQRQVTALRSSRTAFSEARGELLRYAEAVRAADAPTVEMQAEQKRLEQVLAQASAEMQRQAGRTRELRDGLRLAGVDTSNLATSQARLVQAARTGVAALGQLTEAHRRYGDAQRNSGAASNFFEENGRTTLSFMQRLRGEVLALTTAYFGLQGTINLATDSLDKFSSKQAITNQLALSAGNDPRAIGEAYEYVRNQADRIGISFETAAKSYAKFAAAAKLAGRSTDEIRYIYETFAEVGQVAQLSTDDLNGVFKALEQIISKGKIQAEELRGQLGDRLFGAFQIAAKALEDQFPKLDEAMKNGEVTADQLIKIADVYKQTVGDQLPAAMESLRAQQARLNSELFDFKVLIAESGFAESYEKLVVRLTDFFRSEDGVKFAETIGGAFAKLADVLVWLIDNLDKVQLAVELAFGLKAAALVAGFATQIAVGVKALLALSLAAQTGAVKVGLLQKAFLSLAAFFVGWEVGTYLSKEFEVVRQVGVALVTGLMKAFTQLKFAAEVVWVAISKGAENNFNKALNTIVDFKDDVLRALAELATAAGQTDLAGIIAGKVSDGTRRGVTDVRAEVKKMTEQLRADLQGIDDIGQEMFNEASDAARKTAEELRKAREQAKGGAGPTARPDVTFAPADTSSEDGKAQKAYEKLIKQKEALAEQLVNSLAAIDAKIAKNEKLSLEERLRAIDVEYQKVYSKIEKLSKLPGGAPTADQMRSTLAGYIEALKAQETLKFNTEELGRREKTLNEQIALRSQLLETINAQQEAGLLTELQAKEKIAEVDERMVPAIQAAADASIQWAMANSQIFDSPEAMETYIAKMNAIKAGTIGVKNELLSVQQANEMIASLGTTAFDSFAKSIAEGEGALSAFRTAFTQFAADFLKQIALMIIKQILLNALQNSSIGGAVAGGVNASVNHDGGVIGRGGTGRNRNVPSSWFSGAPRYHTGGIAGLAPAEYPAILKRNEEVLTGDDPRNILNGGGGGSSTPQDIKVINMVDSASVVSEGLSTSDGTKAIFNVLKANRSQLKQLVG
jgi:tape measure domain-containing protein